MKIAVVGTGAVGGYYGSMLAQAGHDVHFLLRSDYQQVKAHGLRMRSAVHADVHLPQVHAYQDAAHMPKVDIVLVGLKTTQNEKVLPRLLPHLLHDDTMVVLLQNGLGMEQDLTRHFPTLQMAAGVALICSHKEPDGTIVHEDYGELDLGNYSVKDDTRLTTLATYFEAAGVHSIIQPFDVLRWKKLVWNMSFNGLSVILNQNTREMTTNAESLARCRRIMDEVMAAAQACGVTLPADYADGIVQFTLKMAPYFPSMKLDYDLGRPMELEYLYERPLATARAHGYVMQETEQLYASLRAVPARGRQPTVDSPQ